MNDTRLPLLEDVRIASPCPVRWEDMDGDDRVRHCRACDLQVFNFSNMPRDEAEALLRERLGRGERLCAGFFRRADGTLITRDCPVGLAALRRRARIAMTRVAAAVGLAALGASGAAATDLDRGASLRWLRPFESLCSLLAPARVVMPPPGRWTGGVIACPPSRLPPAGTCPPAPPDPQPETTAPKGGDA